MSGQPPLGMPPATDPGLRWRRARKLYVCDGDGTARRNRKKAGGCTNFIFTGQAYLECAPACPQAGGPPRAALKGEAEPFRSGSRHCEACAREFFAGHLDTRLGSAPVRSSSAEKEEAHA